MLLFIHEIINHINDIINDIELLCHKPFGLLVKYLSMIYLNNIFISDHFQSICPHHNDFSFNIDELFHALFWTEVYNSCF